MDPHSENYYSWSPYAYCGNNPMNLTDPTGKDWRDFLNGVASGFTQKFENIAQAVSHPIDTYNQAQKNFQNQSVGERIGSGIIGAVDNVSAGSASLAINTVQAVASDLNGGDGSATGKVIGGVGADATIAVGTGLAFQAAGKGVAALSKGVAQNEITTVGRWMSKTEYTTMSKTGQMLEGAGGKTSVATGGAEAFKGAAKGSVYAEFGVPTNSLVQGGQPNWFSVIGANANKVMQATVQKQGGQLINEIQVTNLSPIIKIK